MALLRDALSDALAFVLPTSCAGCGEPDISLCDACALFLAPAPACIRTTPGGLVVHSALTFDGCAARVIRALKEDGRTGLARVLGPVLGAVLVAAPWQGAVVPVPSSPRAFRRRGYRPVELLLRRAGYPLDRRVRTQREVHDQRLLGRSERRSNVAGAFRARAGGGAVVLVDDVVTTGATLDEAARALRAAGALVHGAVTLAQTPSLRRRAPQDMP